MSVRFSLASVLSCALTRVAATRATASKAVLLAVLGTTRVGWAQSPDSPPPAKLRSEPSEPSFTPRAPQGLAIAASIVPGVVVHGAGSWLSGDDEAAVRLLLLEGAGLTLTGGSIAAIALTGAARDWVGILASTSILGAGLFSVSLLADVYRTAAPQGLGKHPGAVPWGMTSVGVQFINDPQFDLGPVIESAGVLRTGRWSVSAGVGHAPWSLHSRLNIENGYRLWGPIARRATSPWGGSHGTLALDFEDVRYDAQGFRTSGMDLRLFGRMDSEQLLPNVRGAFFDWELGVGGRTTTFQPSATTTRETLLLGGFGFGAYHGDPTNVGGETRLYYSHRHDGYAGGLLAEGLGSGVIGHVGLEAQHFVSPTWGVRAVTEVGAAWTLGFYVVARAWSDSPTGSGIFDFFQ